MNPRAIVLMVCGAAVSLLLVGIGSRISTADARTEADGRTPCAQWEMTLASSISSSLSATTSTPGTPAVERAPAGWEPFAYLPTGQLSYRRCAK